MEKKKQEAEWSREKGNKRIEERRVWSCVQGKKHCIFYRRSGFPLKTRKKIMIATFCLLPLN